MGEKLDKLLERLGLTEAEYWILHEVYFTERRAQDLIPHAKGLADALGYAVPPREEFEAAEKSLFNRGLIQIVTDETLREIEAELKADPGLGPTEGLPRVGCVDFTRAGAEFRLGPPEGTFRQRSGICPWYYAPGRCRIFSTSKESLIVEAPGFFEKCTVSDPVEVGPWRSRWWRKYSRGYYVEVEYEESDDE